MLKVLIVDDEAIIREGIAGALNWDELECRIVGEADHGAKALELLRLLEPDIVICDIRMPGIDGVELTKHIREQELDIQVIFVTGYDEFAYASEAVKHNVSDFILKPVDSAVLKQAVGKARDALVKSRRLEQDNERFKAMLETNKPILRENFIKRLAASQLTDRREITDKIRFFEMEAPLYQMVVFEIDNYNEMARRQSEYERLFVSFAVKHAIAEQLARRGRGKGDVVEYDAHRFLLLRGFDGDADPLADIEDMIPYIEQNMNISMSSGLSETFADLADAGHYYKQAHDAIAHKFYLGNSSIIHIGDIQTVADTSCQRSYSTKFRQIVDLIKTGRPGQWSLHLQQLLSHRKSIGSLLDATYETKCAMIEFIVSLVKELEDVGMESFQILADDHVYSRILSCGTLDDITSYVDQLITKIIDSNTSNKNNHYNQVVDQAIAYISSQYDADISLQDVAGHVHVNASYLSRIIKKVTGDNFVDILTKTRIENAKQLLKEVNYKTYEVAAMVGIKDSKYFSSLFKKEVGLTPTEYRNTYSA